VRAIGIEGEGEGGGGGGGEEEEEWDAWNIQTLRKRFMLSMGFSLEEQKFDLSLNIIKITS
jgi:hypothetical protein